MSIQSIAWVLEHSIAEGYDRLVLLAIANHCDARGFNAFPAIERIAIEARVSRSTVFKAIHGLAGIGELEVVARGGGRSKANHYRLPMKPSVSATLWDPETVRGEALNGPAQASKRSGSRTPTVINQKQPSRARAREARPTTDPSGSSASGSNPPLDWEEGPPSAPPATRREQAGRARAVREGMPPRPSNVVEINPLKKETGTNG